MFVTQPYLTGLRLHVTVDTQPVSTVRYITLPRTELADDC